MTHLDCSWGEERERERGGAAAGRHISEWLIRNRATNGVTRDDTLTESAAVWRLAAANVTSQTRVAAPFTRLRSVTPINNDNTLTDANN